MERDKISNEKINKALQDSFGIVTTAAKKLRLHPNTLYGWIKNEPELEQMRQDARNNQLKDFVEDALIKNIRKGKEASIIFASKTLLRERGYKETLDIVDKSKFENQLAEKSNAELIALAEDIKKRMLDAS